MQILLITRMEMAVIAEDDTWQDEIELDVMCEKVRREREE